MKHTLFILTFFLGILTSLFTSAQGWEWMDGACDTGSENGESIGQLIATDNSGNVYAVGICWFDGHWGPYTYSAGGIADMPFVKYDSSGNLKWALFAGERVMPFGVAADLFGHEYIFGVFHDASMEFGGLSITNPIHPDTGCYFISKIDSSGHVLWLKSIGNMSGNANARPYGNCMAIDRCGNVFIAATYSYDFEIDALSVVNNGNFDVFIAKLDSSGNTLWGEAFGGIEGEYANAISITSSGFVHVAGLSGTDSLHIGSTVLVGDTTSWKVFVAKFNAVTGNPIWAKTNGGLAGCDAYDVATDEFDNVYLCGTYTTHYSTTPLYFDTIPLPPTPDPFYHMYAYLTKFDINGNAIWAKCTRSRSIWNKQVVVDNCNNVWVLGNNINDPSIIISDTIDGNIVVQPIGSVYPTYIAGWESNGSFITASIIASGASSRGGGIASDGISNIYLTGVSSIDTLLVANDSLYNPNGHTGFGGHPYNMFVAKYNTGFNCTYTPEAPCWPASITKTEIKPEITIYPNPTHDHLTIETPISNYKLSLINTLGQLVYTKEACTGNQTVDVHHLVNGIYYLRIETAERQVINKKVVVQH